MRVGTEEWGKRGAVAVSITEMEIDLHALVAAYNAHTGLQVKFVQVYPEFGYLGLPGQVWATVRPYGMAYVMEMWAGVPDGFKEWWEQRLWR